MDPQVEITLLTRLFRWIAAYAALLVALAIWTGHSTEAMAMLSNLISGYAGAAFAIMRTQDGPK